MIRKLVRLVRLGLAAVGMVWIARYVARTVLEAERLLRFTAHVPLVGVDMATGDRYGVRLTPLSSLEYAAARAREDHVQRDPEHFATAG